MIETKPPKSKGSAALAWIAASFLFSVCVHALGVLLAQSWSDWRMANEPLHSFMETSGGVIGLGVSLLLVVMDRLGRGTSCNSPLVFGLVVMSVLDTLHAVVPPGESFVWLHSMATFAGGALFATVLLIKSRSGGYRLNLAASVVLMGVAVALPYAPSFAIKMVSEGSFTPAAIFLNIGGGALMLAAALKYTHHYFRTQNTDDLLFAVHCLLFGGAAIMFEQSQLWDFSWWWWHGLRLIAYVVALSFAIQSMLQLQLEARQHAEHVASDLDLAKSKAAEQAQEMHYVRQAMDEHTLYSIADRSGKIIDANDGFCRLSGYTREELIGKDHRIVNSGEHPRSFWVDVWRTIASGSPWRGEVCNRAKDGTLYWVDSTIVPWLGADGKPERYISLRLDITEKKRIERETLELAEKVADQEELLHTVVNSVSDGIVAENDAGEFLLFNKAAAEICQGEPSALGPRSWSETAPQHSLHTGMPIEEDDLPIRHALRGEKVNNREVLIRHPDRELHVTCNAQPLSSERHRGAVVTMRDVTEFETMRRQLQESNRLESLGQLSAGVAHEINTPLQCVISNIDFLRGGHSKLAEATRQLISLIEQCSADEQLVNEMRDILKQQRYEFVEEQSGSAITDIQTASQRVAEIVQAMQCLSHPGQSGAHEFNLNEVLSNAATITRNRWKNHAELELELDPQLPVAVGERSKISQVAINLIVNAADAIADKLGDRGELGRITVRTKTNESQGVAFEIEDNGVGIPAEVKERIFEPFFTTKDVGKGTGQGLAISYDIIVNRHGGTLEVESTDGEGTTFSISLPQSEPASPEQDAVEEPAAT